MIPCTVLYVSSWLLSLRLFPPLTSSLLVVMNVATYMESACDY